MRLVLPSLPTKESAHIYERKQALERAFGGAQPSPDVGRPHVTLGWAPEDGLIRGEVVTQGNRPNERVHELAPAGPEAVAEWLERCQEALT